MAALELVVICTASVEELDSGDFARLRKSLHDSASKLYLVRRASNKRHAHHGLSNIPGVSVIDSLPLPLSEARNAGLKQFLRELRHESNVIVAFPDDDCLYPPGLVDEVKKTFSRTGCDFLALPYGPSAENVERGRFPAQAEWLTTQSTLTRVASAGLFVRSDWIRRVGGFDPFLGVGAHLGSGEEIDLVLRLIGSGARGLYMPNPVVLHPYRRTEDLARLPARFALLRRHRATGRLRKQLARAVVGEVRRAFWRPRTIGPRVRAIASGLMFPLGARTEALVSAPWRGIFHPLELPRAGFPGLSVSNVSAEEIVSHVRRALCEGLSRPLLLASAHVTAVNSVRRHDFRLAWKFASATYSDGYSAHLLSRTSGADRAERIATTDLAPLLLKALNQDRPQLRVAVIGGMDGVAEAAGEALATGGVEAVYTTNGFHHDWTASLRQLRAAEPDVVIVGMGMPRELLWCMKYSDELPPAVIITCGGWLRLLMGSEARAPLLIQAMRMEWLYRWFTDPLRVSPRYLIGALNMAWMLPSAICRRVARGDVA